MTFALAADFAGNDGFLDVVITSSGGLSDSVAFEPPGDDTFAPAAAAPTRGVRERLLGGLRR